MGGIFINYRFADSDAYAGMLYEFLTKYFDGALVFLDNRSIPAAADYIEELVVRVRRSDVLLAVIGPDWLTAADSGGARLIDRPDDWIRRELDEAFAHRVPVIPVLTDGARLPTEAELPPSTARLGRSQYRQLRHRDAAADLRRLLADLAAASPGLAAALRSPPGTACDAQPDPGPGQVSMTGLALDHGRVYQAGRWQWNSG